MVSSSAFAQYATDFEAPKFTAGATINGQDAWIATNAPAISRVLTGSAIAGELTTMGITPGTTVHSGSQAVMISSTGSSAPTFCLISGLEAETEVTLDVWVRPLRSTLAATGNVFVVMENSDGKRAAGFRFGPMQSLDYFTQGASWVSTGKRWNENSWYRLSLRVNYATMTYDFLVDGVQANAAPIPFYDASSTTFSQIRIYCGGNQAGMVMDDVSVAKSGPKREIFWSETGGWDGPNLGKIFSAAFDGTGKSEVATNLNRPIGVALDVKSGYIYWAEDGFDPNPSRIVRANFDGSNQTTLFTKTNGFTNAQMIALDLANGKIYWTEWQLGVCCGNLDGTGFTVLGGSGNSTNRYTALALDLERRHIYFAEPQGRGMLFRMDMDGKNVVTVDPLIGVEGDDWVVNSMMLDADNRCIYYPHAMPGADQIIRMNLDSSDKTVLVQDTGREPLGIAFGPKGTMYWINGTGQSVGTAKIDGTENNNQIDATDTATGFGIAAVAVPPKREIFWSETGDWAATFSGMIYSAAYDGSDKSLVATNLARPIGIALDNKNKYLYWAEDGFDPAPSRIVRANWGGSGQTNLFTKDKDGFTNAQMIGLDLANGKIYWTDFYLGVCCGNIDGTGYTLLGGSGNETNRYTELALDLVNRHIYFGEPQGAGMLWRMDMDGKNKVLISAEIGVTGDDWAVNSMTLDAQNGYIYVPHAMTGADQVIRMNLDGSNKTIIASNIGREPLGICLGPNDTMYWICGSGAVLGTAKRDGSAVITPLQAADTTTGFGIAAYIPEVVASLKIAGISVKNSTATISWQGGTPPYQLQRRSSLTQGSWENVGSTTTATEATDTVTGSAMFYRVQSK